MGPYQRFVIKSFKHDGSLHRMWLDNWRVPRSRLAPEHRDLIVLINFQTRIVEASGKRWTSKIPGISVFFPQKWYNVVALLEESGTRYYCNAASPPYIADETVTYIDYDLDVVVSAAPHRAYALVDEEEYERHKLKYRYSGIVEHHVKLGVQELVARVKRLDTPFQDGLMLQYFDEWRQSGFGGSRDAKPSSIEE